MRHHLSIVVLALLAAAGDSLARSIEEVSPDSCSSKVEMAGKKNLSKSADVPVMRQVVIENPIINSPFNEPTRHFRFTDEGSGLCRH